MSKLTWKDLKGNNIVIHTPTENIMKLVANTDVKFLPGHHNNNCSKNLIILRRLI